MRNLAERLKRRLWQSRVAVYGVAMPLTLALGMPTLTGVWRLAMVLFGFSLIIFLHELGHFVVARMCGVKCLAFSVGIGPRMFGWRKGGGFTFGADPYDPEVQEKKKAKGKRIDHVEAATTHSDLPQSAEEAPHSKNIGDTDYRWSWLPLGGYVRMLGQDDMDPTKISTDPRAFNQRPIWQRMCIVSAGVIMNLIFAAVAFSILFSPGVGVDFPPAEIGSVVYDSPAWKEGLRPGDQIIGIAGWRPEHGFLEFTDIKISNALSSGSEKIPYEYLRPGEEKVRKISIQPVMGLDGFLGIGVLPMPSLNLAPKSRVTELVETLEKSKADGGMGKPELAKEMLKVRDGDVIAAVDGKPVSDFMQMNDLVQAAGPHPVTVTLKNRNPKLADVPLQVTPETQLVDGVEDFPKLFGLAPPLQAALVVKGGPAEKGKMESGDVIMSIGARERPSDSEFRRVVKESGGRTVRVVARRGDKVLPLDVAIADKSGTGVIGIGPGYSLENTQAVVRDRNAAGLPVELQNAEGLISITRVDGKPVNSWGEILWQVQQKKAGDKIELTFAMPAASTAATQTAATQAAREVASTFEVTPDVLQAIKDQVEFRLNLPVEVKNRTQVAKSSWGAMIMGIDHTKKFVEQVYMTLAGLVRQTVSPKELHGMLGITKVGYDIQERGLAWFWYLMAMVSVNLAVANFLPLPIVDGGLFLLLILEKIRGKPLSLKLQAAIQVVGIVLLAGMFLFVTWNDLGLFTK
jgi:regulator of sigma E protease